MCDRRFPVLVWGRTYYVACTLPRGHDEAHEGVVHEYGTPR